ncbi:MAG: hypothetical protein ACLGHC_08705 [Alphaproteobacteria bacterium]
MKLKIAISGFALAAASSFALPAVANAQQTDSGKATVDAIGHSLEVKGLAFDCAELLNKHQRQLDEIRIWKNVGSMLQFLGWGVAALSVKMDLDKGEWGAATDTVVDEATCTAFGPLCAPYKIGKSIGSLLDNKISAAVGSDRTLNQMWSDTLAGWVYGSGEPSAAQIEQMITRHRQKLQELEAAAKPPPPMCKTEDEDDVIADLLEKAKADAAATPMTPVDSGLSEQTDQAIRTGRAGSDSAMDSQAQAMQQQVQRLGQSIQASQNNSAVNKCDLYVSEAQKQQGAGAEAADVLYNTPEGAEMRKMLNC